MTIDGENQSELIKTHNPQIAQRNVWPFLPSNIEHVVLQVFMNLHTRGTRVLFFIILGHTLQVTSRSPTNEVRVVGRSAQAHSICCPAEDITHTVREILQNLGDVHTWIVCCVYVYEFFAKNFIIDDVVMAWTSGSLYRIMCL